MRILVSQSSGVPLYEQIVEQVIRAILAGDLAAGDALPSLRALAADLRVSLITTTRAYAELTAAGWIVSVPGRGAFVCELDPARVRAGALERVRADLTRAVSLVRDGEHVTLTDLHHMLEEEWRR